MTEEDLKKYIQKRFKEVMDNLGTFASVAVTVPVQYDNEDVTVPDNSAPWCRMTIKTASARQVSTGSPGNNRYRKTGIVIVQLFTPGGQGSGLSDYICRKIEDAYTENVSIYGVTYDCPLPGDGRRDGEQWQVNVTIPFRSDRLA